MKTEQALTHFRASPARLAEILKLDTSTVRKWGGVIPLDHAARLGKLSFGALEIDWDCYDERGKPRGE